jgi:hypothetical protein
MNISGGGGSSSTSKSIVFDSTKIRFRSLQTEMTEDELKLKAAYCSIGTDNVICAYCKHYQNMDTYSTKNCEREFRRFRENIIRASKNIARTEGCPNCCKCDKCHKRISKKEKELEVILLSLRNEIYNIMLSS